ncbi:hypothetical protein [Nocardioides sp.]|uniref:hypothetical protein n=1 Tax=Nocardioides sp. TaxID=35761 RepID=UPI0025DD6C69|nr:hypothetical protein [Nocardioides sp.]
MLPTPLERRMPCPTRASSSPCANETGSAAAETDRATCRLAEMAVDLKQLLDALQLLVAG